MRYRVLRDGEVINHVEWDRTTGWQPPEGCTLEPVEDAPEDTPDPDEVEATRLMHEAMGLLGHTDFVVIKATEKDRILSQDWLAWREELRATVATRSGVIRPEPPRYGEPIPSPATVEAVDESYSANADLFGDEPDPRDKALAAENASLRDQLEAANRRVAELEQAEAPLLLAPDAPKDEGEDVEIDPKDAETIIDGFVGELREGREVAEGTMRSMASHDRKKLFSILNDDLGRLKNEEALLGKSIPRRADVESLLGILARVGEA